MTDKHIFIEQWNTRPAWRQLSLEARQAFAARIGEASAARPEGVRVIAWGHTDLSAPLSVEHAYWAVWEMDSAAALAAFLQGVEASGWYEYFEQVNTVGRFGSAQEVLEHLVAAPGTGA